MSKKFFFLLHTFISYTISYSIKAYFELFCDDYTIQAYSGSKTLYSQNPFGLTCKVHKFEKVINVEDQISISCKNIRREFGFAGSVDYHYFKVTTNNKNLWTIEDNSCNDNSVVGGYNNLDKYTLIGITNHGKAMNSKICTFSFDLFDIGLCSNKNIYYNSNKQLLFTDFLQIEKGDYFNDLTMIVNVNPGNEGIIQFEKDGNIIDNGEVSGDYLIKYIEKLIKIMTLIN